MSQREDSTTAPITTSVHVAEGHIQGMAATSIYIPRVSCNCLLLRYQKALTVEKAAIEAL